MGTLIRISVGILAHNEEERIGTLISDLQRQTLFAKQNILIQVFVVANGCTDATADVARLALSQLANAHNTLGARVHILDHPGKANAWNVFVHDLAPPDTDYVFLLDADIRLFAPATLELLLDSLVANQRAVIAVGESVSDLRLRETKTIAEKLIRRGTGTATDPRTAVTGQLYCARLAHLSKMYLPLGLPVENGFVRGMILTDNFRSHEDLERLVFVEGAQHVFESNRTLSRVFRHNVRLVVGTGINVLLFKRLRKLSSKGIDLASYIRGRNESDPRWLNELVTDELRSGKFFVIGGGVLTQRLTRLRRLRLRDQAAGIPILCVGLFFDLLLYVKANGILRAGRGSGFW